ncbi:hypothetical protein N9L19_00920 [bacterium]|nr:hypothetical protein [bacterium]
MIGRYGDVMKKLKSDMGHHHQRKCLYLMTTQEPNMLHRGAFTHMLERQGRDDLDPDAETAGKKPTATEKRLRKNACNQMVT